METVIIVSVLSTLGVVAVLTSIVVAFIKLKNKVDVKDHREEITELYQLLDSKVTTIYNDIQNTERSIFQELEHINRTIDSRCDKLDSKIKTIRGVTVASSNNTDKQILND